MEFEKSKYYQKLKPYKYKHAVGNYYFCEKFFVSEIKEGIHFNWEITQKMANEIINFYGVENPKIGFISNRINSYSVDPTNWTKVEENYNIISSAIVIYNKPMLLSASLEQKFAKKPIKYFKSLNKAIEWTESINKKLS